MTPSLILTQNKLTLLNSRLVVAQREGDEEAFIKLTAQINAIQESIESLVEEN